MGSDVARTIVITGGTDGMGAALVRHYLRRGDEVVVVGRRQDKFDALVAAAADEAPEAADRAEFLEADLSLVGESLRVVGEIRDRRPRVDALILAASYVRWKRAVTEEGHEASWVLFFVSKYVLTIGLKQALTQARRPVIVNTAVPGAPADAIRWDDLELERKFSFKAANLQQRRANELLGLMLTQVAPIRYVTWGPSSLVRTSMQGDVGPGMTAATRLLRLFARPPEVAVEPIIRLVDTAMPGRSAYRGDRPVRLAETEHDVEDAARLARLMNDVVRAPAG